METCERCGDVTSSDVWTRNNGICDKCNGATQTEADDALLSLTEKLCEINPKQGLRVRILLFTIEWCTEKLIFPKEGI